MERFFSAKTSSFTLSMATLMTSSSRRVMASGIMISGRTSTPSAATSHAASKMARACIS